MSEPSKSQNGLFKARTLASAAGISTNLLRAWERRYPLFEPERQPSLHRLYTEEDMAVIRRVRQLLDSGLAIGEVAALGRQALLKKHQLPVEPSPALAELTPLSPDLEDLIADLGPCNLGIQRPSRFAGEELGVSLRQLHPVDIATTYRLYQVLKGIYEIWVYMEQNLVRRILLGRLRRLFADGFPAEIRALGAATETSDPLVLAALEDSRGGALAVLTEYLERDDPDKLSSSELYVILTLARDHAKMMRNAFFDLDEGVREADETAKAHSLRPLLLKLAAFRSRSSGFQTGTNYQGPISCRCLETSALDRVTYNFLGRAFSFQDGGGALWVSRVNQQLCRWAFECTVEQFRLPAEQELPVKAVALAMGVTPEEALSYAYLGTARRAGRLWAWFHWPVYEPAPDVPYCRCEPLGM